MCAPYFLLALSEGRSENICLSVHTSLSRAPITLVLRIFLLSCFSSEDLQALFPDSMNCMPLRIVFLWVWKVLFVHVTKGGQWRQPLNCSLNEVYIRVLRLRWEADSALWFWKWLDPFCLVLGPKGQPVSWATKKIRARTSIYAFHGSGSGPEPKAQRQTQAQRHLALCHLTIQGTLHIRCLAFVFLF